MPEGSEVERALSVLLRGGVDAGSRGNYDMGRATEERKDYRAEEGRAAVVSGARVEAEKRMRGYQTFNRNIIEVDGEPTMENEPIEVIYDEIHEACVAAGLEGA